MNRKPDMQRLIATISIAFAVMLTGFGFNPSSAFAQNAQAARGKYLVTLGGCMDCHTPGYFFGKPDMDRFLGGSEVGFEVPGLGIFYGPNLTPDKETGLGGWSDTQIITAFRTGKRPDGRELAPIMPWRALGALTDADAQAIVSFLRSIKPVKNKVAGPFGPNEKPASFVMQVIPAANFKPTPVPPMEKK